MEAHLSPVRESKNASEKHSASPPSAGNHRRSGFPFKRISSASEVLGRGASLEGTHASQACACTDTHVPTLVFLVRSKLYCVSFQGLWLLTKLATPPQILRYSITVV